MKAEVRGGEYPHALIQFLFQIFLPNNLLPYFLPSWNQFFFNPKSCLTIQIRIRLHLTQPINPPIYRCDMLLKGKTGLCRMGKGSKHFVFPVLIDLFDKLGC